MIISVKNITKTYKLYTRHRDRVIETFSPFGKNRHHPFCALKDITFDIQKGETVGIVGRNGSGKSTLLQILCGIIPPTSGIIEVEGKISALLELGAGFNPEFTGRENTYINAAIMGLTTEEIDSCFDDIVDFADIGEYVDQPVKTYSSGMYVRLAFAIAINVHPDILVVDEALAVGDTLFQAKCFQKFRQFQKQGVTILFVTHSLDLVTKYCTSAILLEKGKLYYNGSPKSVVDEYNRLMVNCSRLHGDEPLPSQEVDLSVHDAPGHPEGDTMGSVCNPDENRYGNGKVKIVHVGLYTQEGEVTRTIVHGREYEFRMKVEFYETIREPIFAYTIKDVKGYDISGTNTYYQDIDTGTVREGSIVTARFRQIVPLNTGGYLISFGCAGFEDGEYVVYERRYDCVTFEVVSDRPSVGIFDLHSAITIETGIS